jgi:RNA polymerase sigma factor (sigma-70 family)
MTVAKNQERDHALEELLEELQPRLRGVLASFRIPYEDAEDLMQQSVLTYLHKRERIQDPGRWLVGTLKNRCLMYWRSHRRQLYESVDAALLESIAEPRRPKQETADLTRDLNRILAKMPERCRNLLHLRYALGCEPSEAAERLGYRRSSIYKILERCLAGLTRRLVAVGMVAPRRDSGDDHER